jgi:hypothetical protein
MAPNLAAAVSQFEMPGPFVHVGLVQQAGPAKTLQCAVNRDLVESLSAHLAGDLLMRERFLGLGQHFEHCYSALGAIQIGLL